MRLYHQRSLHLIYKNRFSIKRYQFLKNWPEFQSMNVFAGRFIKWYPLAHLTAITMLFNCKLGLKKLVQSRWLDIGLVLFALLLTTTSSRSMEAQTRTWPISSHPDWISLVNDAYVLVILPWSIIVFNRLLVCNHVRMRKRNAFVLD